MAVSDRSGLPFLLYNFVESCVVRGLASVIKLKCAIQINGGTYCIVFSP